LAGMQSDNALAAFVADTNQSTSNDLGDLERQRGELMLTGEALRAYRYETELLNDARRAGVAIGPEELAMIREASLEYAGMAENIARQREEIEFSRRAIRSFMGDLVQGLRDGKSAWEAFGDAAMGVVDRILQRLLDMAAEEAFLQLFGAFSGGGQAGGKTDGGGGILGILGTLAGAIGAFTGGGAGGMKGGGVKKFAKGGEFTNGVYDSPTLFKFANGGQFGMMGEAGPEAVMPLKRGPDGSLGVQVTEAAAQSVRVIVTTDDDRFNSYVDDRSSTMIADAAPSIANAGARIGIQKQRFQQSRRIPGT
jgi:hypothetical protein